MGSAIDFGRTDVAVESMQGKMILPCLPLDRKARRGGGEGCHESEDGDFNSARHDGSGTANSLSPVAGIAEPPPQPAPVRALRLGRTKTIEFFALRREFVPDRKSVV